VEPHLAEPVASPRAEPARNRVAALLPEALRRSLVPASVADLTRRGVAGVRLVPPEALEAMIAERAERIASERIARALEAERARALTVAREEARALAQALREAQEEAAAEARRARALASERDEALSDLAEARGARAEALRQMAEAEGAFEGARRAAEQAERALERERAALAAGLREAERRAAAAEAATRQALEKAEAFAEAARAALSRPRSDEGKALARIEARLRAIEARLGAAGTATEGSAPVHAPARAVPIAVTSAHHGATPTAAWVTGSDDGIPSKYGPGVRAGLRPGDPRFEEKSGILARLVRENLKLRSELKRESKGGNP
jgi:hypothetical protein